MIDIDTCFISGKIDDKKGKETMVVELHIKRRIAKLH